MASLINKLLLLLLLLLIPASIYAQGSASTLDPTTLVTQTNGVFKFIAREAPPSAATAALAGAGAGNVDNGAHIYKVTFVTAQGQTSGGTSSVTVTVTDKTVNGKVSLSSIPTGSPFVTSRKIYRTVAAGSVFKLLTTINDNSTTTYTDNTADASLTTTLPAPNTTANNFFQYANSGGLVTIPRLNVTTCTGCGTGTVTSVSVVTANGFSGSVANPTTTPAITLSTSITGLLKGNGTAISAASAGTDYQAAITFGTGVLTALGVNVGSAGAPVLFNGALGTPSSGIVTNLTGTASININGTVGATTPATGVFTTTTIGAGSAITSSGPGGALGSNAFNSTAYMPLAGGTFTGDVTHSSAALILSGNISASGIFGTGGIRVKGVAATFTDTTSSGTIATAYNDVLGGNTWASSSATTITNAFALYLNQPIQGTNVTLTNKWALGADSAKFGTSNQVTISTAGAVNIPGTFSINGNAMTFPSTSATIARADAGQTFTGTNTMGAGSGAPLIVNGGSSQNVLVWQQAGTDIGALSTNGGIQLVNSRSLKLYDGGSLASPGNYKINIGQTAAVIQLSSEGIYGFNSAASITGNPDANISRNAAGIIQFGTTAANALGSWTATNGTLSGTLTGPTIIGGTTTTSTLALRATSGAGTTGADVIVQRDGTAEIARFVANGNVGIGVTVPNLGGSIPGPVLTIGAANYPGIELATSAADAAGQVVGDIDYVAVNNTSGKRVAAILSVTEGATANNRGAYLAFYTKVNAGALTERMRISSGGGVTFTSGVTDASGTPGSLCYNTSTFEMTKNNALTCTVSSRDFKQNIIDLKQLSAFDKLRPVEFAYRDQPLRSRWGFIAEEAAEADRRFADGYDANGIARSLDQNAILALTVKEVQRLKARVAELDAKGKQ